MYHRTEWEGCTALGAAEGPTRVVVYSNSAHKGTHSPPDSASVLQWGSESSTEFLAKILYLDVTLFLCNTQFYFPLSALSLVSLAKEFFLQFTSVSQLVVFLRYHVGDFRFGCQVGWFLITRSVKLWRPWKVISFSSSYSPFLTLIRVPEQGGLVDFSTLRS